MMHLKKKKLSYFFQGDHFKEKHPKFKKERETVMAPDREVHRDK